MHQHAMLTAATLYSEGTWDVETAARQAGVTPSRLEHAAARCGLSASGRAHESAERARAAAD